MGPVAFKAAVLAAGYGPKAALVAIEYGPTLSSLAYATVIGILVRRAWKRLPDWVTQDVSFRCLLSLKNGKEEQEVNLSSLSNNELTNLNSVISKLQLSIESYTSRVMEPVPYLHASLLAYLSMSGRWLGMDNFHCECDDDDNINVKKVSLKKLKECLDYATWAYSNSEELENELHNEKRGYDWELVRQVIPGSPGQVGHFVAISHAERIMLVGVKGTSTLEDFITDCCGKSHYSNKLDLENDYITEVSQEKYELIAENNDDNEVVIEYNHDMNGIQFHEGIWLSTKRLFQSVIPLVQKWSLQEKYNLLLCGHSLGAGAASLLGLLLRNRFPELSSNACPKIEVYAFAPPPVLDYNTALASSSYITSIVNNADVIPRTSAANVSVLFEFLRAVSNQLKKLNFFPLVGPKSSAAFLQMLASNDSDYFMTLEEVKQARENAQKTVDLQHPDHLYIPGTVILIYEHLRSKHMDVPKLSYTLTDGASSALRFFDVNKYRNFTDHLTSSYYTSIEQLLSQEIKPT